MVGRRGCACGSKRSIPLDAGARKAAQLGNRKAEQQVRALLATPLLDLDIEKAKDTIEEAEEANVMPSLIDKAVEHTEEAAEAQMAAAGDELL